jgi:hypothetical protein
VVEHLWKERVRAAVVERDVRRCANDHERAGGVDLEGRERGRVGLEVGEVVLLLQARVLQ